MIVLGSLGVIWGQGGWLKIRVDSAADKVHRGSHWVEFERVETCLMKVVIVMGSDGVRRGQRGWLKIQVESLADKVHRVSHWVEF